MAIDVFTGLESGGLDDFNSVSGAAVVSTAGLDMDGNYCLALIGDTDFASISLAADTERWGAMLFRLDSAALTQVFSFFSGATLLGNVVITAAGYVQVFIGSTLVATSSIILIPAQTYHFEFYYKLSASPDGRFTVKSSGIPIISFQGETRPGTEATFDAFRLGYAGVSGKNANARYDNIVLDDAAYVGRYKIQGSAVSGAGTTGQLTASAGNAYECIDEIPASDTDFIYSNTVGHLSTFTGAALSGTIVSVKAMKVMARVKKEGAATPTSIQLAIRSGTTDYFSGDNLVGTDWHGVKWIKEVDPDTSSAWIEAGVNGSERGVKLTA